MCTGRSSLRERRGLHLHPASARRGPLRLRVGRRALVAGADARDDPAVRHQHAERAERREPRQRRGRAPVAGRSGGLPETVSEGRTREPGG